MRDGFHYKFWKFWVYILVSRIGTLYIGITGYFDRRISQHKIDSISGDLGSLFLIRDHQR